jgi:transcriptional regulator with XRE-family HTH domain
MSDDLLGKRVLLSRRDLNIDQRELSRRSGVSATYISKIERGHVHNVTIEVVFKLASGLGLSPGYLLGLTDIPLDDPGTPLQATESTLTFEIRDWELRRTVQELIAILVELAPEDRKLVFDMAERIWRSEKREPRIIG